MNLFRRTISPAYPKALHPRIELEVIRTQRKALLAMPEIPARSFYRVWIAELMEKGEYMTPYKFYRLHKRLCDVQGYGEVR